MAGVRTLRSPANALIAPHERVMVSERGLRYARTVYLRCILYRVESRNLAISGLNTVAAKSARASDPVESLDFSVALVRLDVHCSSST